MGIRWWLFSGEESITGVELGLWAQTWGSRRSPAWSLLDFRLPSTTASFFLPFSEPPAQLFGSLCSWRADCWRLKLLS